MGAGASTPRKAQPDGDADDETNVRAILAELGGCGVPQMGIAAESLRLAVASDGPMRNQVRSHLEARRCAAGLDFLIAVDDYKHTRGPDDDAVRDRAREVHARFVASDAPAEVTLPRRVRDAVAHKLSSGEVGNGVGRPRRPTWPRRWRGTPWATSWRRTATTPCFWRRCDGQGRVRRVRARFVSRSPVRCRSRVLPPSTLIQAHVAKSYPASVQAL